MNTWIKNIPHMGNLKTKDLTKIGFANNQLISLALGIASKHFKHQTNDQIIAVFTDIKNNPGQYLDDEVTGKIAAKVIGKIDEPAFKTFDLRTSPAPYKIYGGKDIEAVAKKQMDLAMLLPVSVQGALMPDAHMGFGLPIGGVLATDNVVIPYAVGMDIGCGMALTIIDETDAFIKRYDYQLRQALKNHTHFGMEGGLDTRQEHEALDSPVFGQVPFLKQLRSKAVRQLGTSGSGNHFVEFGEIELAENNTLGLPGKKYAALLSHSGSRGLGAAIAKYYTQVT